MATPRTTDRTGTLEESVYERIENAGEEDKEGERTGGEQGTASLQS